MSPNKPTEITGVCTNYQELLNSDDFKRIMKIAIKKSGLFQEEAIITIFEKLGKAEDVSEQEKTNLVSFLDNNNVKEVIIPILEKFSDASLPGTKNREEQKLFGKFLDGIFTENGFENTKNGILEQAGIEIAEQVSNTIELSSEAQKIQEAIQKHGLEKYVTVNNSKTTVQTDEGLLTFAFSHTEGGQDFKTANKPYTREQGEALIKVFGNKSDPYMDILRLKKLKELPNPIYLLPSLNSSNIIWGFYFNKAKVSMVNILYKNNIFNALSLQN